MMTSREIRQQFLQFFERQQHKIVASAPIVVKNDPTLMFTNAGMNQFKDLFLGNKPVQYPRIADTQKCLRVSGKHNDLEEVGVDTYHHTMFEMLGNWSFGDYFKKESITWGWQLLTDIYKLDPSRLYVTVFEGDPSENLAFDTDAYDVWKSMISEAHILRGNKKDNFWEMGDTGPCGPCSEIHYDMRGDAERSAIDGATLVNTGDPQVIEIWNHVFIQFNRKADGSLEELPNKHVDTGMGFERLVRALQGKSSNYDTDVFTPLIRKVETLSGFQYGQDEKTDIAMRVISDHIRAVSFCIADGQLPSNNGAGYVVRRILRRAIRYGYSFLHLKKPFFNELVAVLAEQFRDVFPELEAQRDLVSRVIMEEERAFLRTLENGIKRLDDVTRSEQVKSAKIIPGAVAFELFDTYGFPLDLTMLIVREHGLDVDSAGFEAEMQKQKERSRQATGMETGDWMVLRDDKSVDFIGYDHLQSESRVVKMRSVKMKNEMQYQVVLNKTPFYAESGGQTGDTGTLSINANIIRVLDTKKENDLIIHFTDQLPENTDAVVYAEVDARRRTDITYNHTATHLIHAALRQVLGSHVQQKGSYVGPDRLRFDFSHFSKVSDEELRRIEQIVNAKIRENIPVVTKVMPIAEAQQLGAMMLFGEKYGETVRVVIADENYSKEFCGGTHVGATGEIGYCRLVNESAVAAGIRRIEAITGSAIEKYMDEQHELLKKIQDITKVSDVVKSVQSLADENAALKKEVEQFQLLQVQQVKAFLLNAIETTGGMNIIRAQVDLGNADLIKKLAYELRNEVSDLVCLLAADIQGKASLTLMISDNLVESKGYDAAKLIRELGKQIEGGGGGQKFFATAGGKNTGGLRKALDSVTTLL
ncbi:MAG TPA: alanine--tRNA ligase [Chitinophagales bacterium]|nr:alanine--tRNA ligase [Chitinophagales bacterium]HNK97521.1 alanine--tRNA ligase [Chitinophagales bacterium]HNM08326.1 alanine--tRNA ligase [Chitinophagales bacterium]